MLVTSDQRMLELLKMCDNVAPSRATVLIHGESGTGKELFAKYIHGKSSRAPKRLIAINCAAVPDGLLESELFGFEKGAFTGAHSAKAGKFELAHESTFLLDEVSELPLLLQGKLLRLIQEGEVERLGAKQPVKINVRLIATTNRDLAEMVRDGKFREDLYYRLNVIPIQIPPLRERKSDIQKLAKHFLDLACEKNGLPFKSLSDEAILKLQDWQWVGNVRELENVIERSVLMSKNLKLNSSDIWLETQGRYNPIGEIHPGTKLSEMEKKLILKTLEYTKENRTHAAELLGISVRTLRNKLHEYRKLNEEEIRG